MADINAPREYFAELMAVSDELDEAKTAQKKASDSKKQLESSLTSLKKTIEKEKNNTVKKRRAELASGYDRQLKAIDSDIKRIKERRQKELNAQIKKKTEQATSGVRQQAADARKSLKEYACAHKLPMVLRSRIYYRLFCPGYLGYLLLTGLFAVIMAAAVVVAKNRIVAGSTAWPFIVICIADLVLLFVYILVWSNTRVRYKDEINDCLAIIKSIKTHEKTTRRIEKDIRTAGDDNTYDLAAYDEELASMAAKREDTDSSRSQALDEFDNVTRQSLIDGIDANYRVRLEGMEYDIGKADKELGELEASVSALEARLGSEFIPYVGSRNITHARIEKMISLIDSGSAATVSEAVAQLEQAEK